MVVKIIRKGNKIEEEKLIPQVSKTVVFVKKKKLSPRELKVVEQVKNGAKSKAKILKNAGYGKHTQRNPQEVFDRPQVAEAIDKVVEKMQRIRDKALDALEGKDFTKQSPYNLVIVTGQMTKDSELLSGRPTDRTQYELPEDEKARLRKLLQRNKAK